MRTKKDSGRGRMEDEDLAITYIDEPGCRVLDLAKAGLREVPMLNFSRRRHFRGPTSPHRHAGCLEVGICLRGALTLLNNNREYRSCRAISSSTSRLEKSKRLLTESDTPVSKLAHDLGFCASQHFSSHFKRAYGITPNAWRKQQALGRGHKKRHKK